MLFSEDIVIIKITSIIQGGPKTDSFLELITFRRLVIERCVVPSMSKVSKFCPEMNYKTRMSVIFKYSLPSLYK